MWDSMTLWTQCQPSSAPADSRDGRGTQGEGLANSSKAFGKYDASSLLNGGCASVWSAMATKNDLLQRRVSSGPGLADGLGFTVARLGFAFRR